MIVHIVHNLQVAAVRAFAPFLAGVTNRLKEIVQSKRGHIFTLRLSALCAQRPS
ncbi:MAG TPA: hypothetical protein VMI06_01270 [Terriglobia bacterium]|nr:hypothetical protein [Terriglobia bacterium]